MTEDEIKETYLYRYCLNNCNSEELKLSLASELKYAYEEYRFDDGFDWTAGLSTAFIWRGTPQGPQFWSDINLQFTPEGYK